MLIPRLVEPVSCITDRSPTFPLVHVVAVDSSESSGESVSGFSSSGHSFHSTAAGEAEDASSVCSSTVTIKEAAEAAVVLAAQDSPAGPDSLATSAEPLHPSAGAAAADKPQCRAGEISCSEVR